MNHRTANRCFSSIGVLVLMGLGLAIFAAAPASAQDSPVIDVWSGLTQQYGHIGDPQPWVNILGNVSDADGISTLVYTLNGGSDVTLTVGPDGRRLQSSGDFNIDLATADLVDGPNTVVITAVDNGPADQTVVTVTVNYDLNDANVWPLPYSVDWNAVTAIEDVGQIVDGLWSLSGGEIRTAIPGYDRLIAMGDMAWDDYEITVPITMHSMPSSYGAGILMRWNGHTDDPVPGLQPKSGWLPLGAICWYQAGDLEIYGNNGDILGSVPRTLSLDVPYVFKVRVETIPGVGGKYSFKVWEEGQPEPLVWDVTGQDTLTDPQAGSLMLISHLADVSFGEVAITSPPVDISNIAVTLGAGATEATVTWDTSEPADSSVDYGLTTGYEIGTVSDGTLVTNHSITLIGLVPDNVYHYEITSVDGLANPVSSGDQTFSTLATDIVSDDFSSPTLDTNIWTFVDPLTDGSYTLTGTNTSDAWVNISVPSGVEHQVWEQGIEVPHLLQSVNNADFEVEVKFESTVDLQYQEQGILIKQDDTNYMRFEFFGTNSNTVVFAATIEALVANIELNDGFDATGVAPLYMRVKRVGDQWTQTYSYDGAAWLPGVTFTHAITVTGVGIYAGNGLNTGSPAHTASIDYFFETASPVVPEDPTLPWSLNDIAVATGETSAIVTWTTEEPTTSSVAYGPTAAYEMGSVSDPAFVTNHSITLTGLDPLTLYHFEVTSEDISFNAISSLDMTFTTLGPDLSGIESDDFSSGTLNTSLWTLVDPKLDVVFTLTGQGTVDAWANLAVPAGVEHQVYTSGIEAPHLLQAANDEDFEVEVKFETPVTTAYQEQGVLIKQDDDTYMRFEFFSNGSNTTLYASGYTSTTSDNYVSTSIGSNGMAPLYMRVKRQGDQWTQSHSFDGTNWIAQTSFTHVLTVAGLGPYSGNASGGTSPAHTASIDYFFNTASPVDPEDPVGPTASIVAANTSGVLGLSTANTCEVGIPVEITRAGTENMRGFTATVNLANLALCNGVASIQEGTYLSNVGATLMQTVDNLDGTYTVDIAILGDPCGATDPTGVLFTIDVTNTIPDGTGTITLTDLVLRDCDNIFLDVASGAPADIVIDSTPPVNVTGLTATQVLTGNPAGNVTAIDLAWTPSVDVTAVQTLLYRKAFGGYPEYDDAGGTAPVAPTDPVTENWILAATLTAVDDSFSDMPALRDYWYFCTVSTDLYGNQSTSLITGGDLNYLLGDVSDGGVPRADGDNHVAVADISLLGSRYGTSDGDALYLNTMDVGPTHNLSIFGHPTTDDVIDFEDLMMFSLNFDRNASEVGPAPFMAAAPQPADRNSVHLDVPELPSVGQTFTVDLVMTADGQVQGLRIPLLWDDNTVELVGFQGGQLLTDQGGQSFALSTGDGAVDIALIGIRERGISGVGTVARAVFRVIETGAAGLQIGDMTARDKTNQSVEIGIDEASGTPGDIVLPMVSALNPNYPNPFNPMTTISFDLAEQGRVRISIFSIDGRLVKTLTDESLSPGRYERVWQGRDNGGRAVASGTYLYRMEGPGIQQTRRMLLIK